jgi:hypothetical protein
VRQKSPHHLVLAIIPWLGLAPQDRDAEARAVVVDGAGRPCATARVAIAVAPLADGQAALPAPRALEWTRTETDDGGRLRAALRSATAARAARCAVHVRVIDPGRPLAQALLLRGAIELDRPWPDGGSVDLGTVEVSPPPELVAGRIVAGDGPPPPGLRIMVREPDAVGIGWVEVDQCALAVAQDGRFDVRADARPARVSIYAGAPGYAWSHAEGPPGSKDLVVRLTALPGLSGRVLLDPSIDPRLLHVVVRSGPGTSVAEVEADATFACRGLRAPTATLAVRIDNADFELARLDDVPARDDAEPTVIDLRGRIRAVRARVLDADGRAVGGSAVQLADDDGRAALVQTDADGRLITLVPAAAGALTVRLAGEPDGRTGTLPPASGEVDVTLRRR